MINFAGHPYVDVRNYFNSYLPNDLSDEMSHKLINYYLDRLKKYPEYHDKVEFEVVLSSLSFDFDIHAKYMINAGFTNQEIEEIRLSLLKLTDDLVNDKHGLLFQTEKKADRLLKRRIDLLKRIPSISEIPTIIEALLQDCIEFGALPFSIFVRGAFIGAAFLRSLITKRLITPHQYEQFLNSIQTVTTEFTDDLHRCEISALSKEAFLERYGHLRPGTYDITVPTYYEKPDLYLSFDESGIDSIRRQELQKSKDFFSSETLKNIQDTIISYGFTFHVDDLFKFIRYTYTMRELMKFEFTKNLSLALDYIRKFGEYYGFTREDLAFLYIEDIIRSLHVEMTTIFVR